MKSKTIILISLIVIILFSNWTPASTAQAATTNDANASGMLQLVIKNKGSEQVKVTLIGPETYTFNANPGKNFYQVQSGKYKFEYKACNVDKKGTIEVKKNGQIFNIEKCKTKNGKGAGEISVTVKNDTSGYIRLVLTGPASYDFSLKPGSNTIKVLKGKYQYIAYGCGATISGTVKIRRWFEWKFFCY